ncbi:MAG: fumarylacetoacetate hydrolase family protein, partial [Actinomycetota bacterium]|nr:fumarylacetoacetate hydrolase family protein [Actinomycetota bacterium]
MRLATIGMRLCIIRSEGALDVETVTEGRFSADPQQAFERWDELRRWYAANEEALAADTSEAYESSDLGPPVPAPRQIFGIGLNYRDHAAEANLDLPTEHAVVFAKFPASVTGPFAEVKLPSDAVDFEAELVLVIGRGGHRITRDDAWEHVAGLTLGQDLSERQVQWRGPSPQFSLGKSYPGFAPIGPVLVTPDEFPDRENVGLGCALNGRTMQKGTSRDMVFSIPQLVEQLSAVVPLLPGDLVFTGTPAGI